MNRMTTSKLLFLIVSLSFCKFAEGQDYSDVQLPGKNIWLQYPTNVGLRHQGEVRGLWWVVEDEPSIKFIFGYISEEGMKVQDRLNESVGEIAGGPRFIIEPRKVKIGSFDATEWKVLLPEATAAEESDEVWDSLIHTFIIEIDEAFYGCDMYDDSRDHHERYTETFLRLCNSVKTEQP